MENLMLVLNKMMAYLQLNMAWSYHLMGNNVTSVAALNMALQSFTYCEDTAQIAYCRALIAEYGGTVIEPQTVVLPSNEAYIQRLGGLMGKTVEVLLNAGQGTSVMLDIPFEDGENYTVIPFGFDSLTYGPVNCKISFQDKTKFVCIPDKDCKLSYTLMKNLPIV